MRVLSFTAVVAADGWPVTGGVMSSRLLIRRLCEDESLEVRVIVAGDESARGENEAFLHTLGVLHKYIPLRRRRRPPLLSKDWFRRLQLKYFGFGFEMAAFHNPGVSLVLKQLLRDWESEVLIVDYLHSASLCSCVDVPVVLVTMNREVAFLRELLSTTKPRARLRNEIAVRRVARFERRVHSKCSKVVVLSETDIPPSIDPARTVCITPYLDEQPDRWQYGDSKSAFFVGHVGHYPNRRAMEFIAKELAPRIAAIRGDVRVKIVGAGERDVPEAWRHPSIDYLGVGNATVVQDLFRTADLLVCPIANDFGMKFKVAEALSYGTPVALTPETAKCVPYLENLPLLRLSDPQEGASLICRLVGNQTALKELSRSILEQQRRFMATQQKVWSRTLATIPELQDRNRR